MKELEFFKVSFQLSCACVWKVESEMEQNRERGEREKAQRRLEREMCR